MLTASSLCGQTPGSPDARPNGERIAPAPPETRSVQALAGTGSVPWKSGESATVQMRFACLKPLRNAWYQFAWQRTRDEPWAEASEQRKRAEGKRHRMAVRALATVWVRVILALWTTREASQRATFEEAQRLHARRAA